jgi:hypothetical protein
VLAGAYRQRLTLFNVTGGPAAGEFTSLDSIFSTAFSPDGATIDAGEASCGTFAFCR